MPRIGINPLVAKFGGVGNKAPSDKRQAPEKLQTPNTNATPALDV
jgi:hypothetical protein